MGPPGALFGPPSLFWDPRVNPPRGKQRGWAPEISPRVVFPFVSKNPKGKLPKAHTKMGPQNSPQIKKALKSKWGLKRPQNPKKAPGAPKRNPLISPPPGNRCPFGPLWALETIPPLLVPWETRGGKKVFFSLQPGPVIPKVPRGPKDGTPWLPKTLPFFAPGVKETGPLPKGGEVKIRKNPNRPRICPRFYRCLRYKALRRAVTGVGLARIFASSPSGT